MKLIYPSALLIIVSLLAGSTGTKAQNSDIEKSINLNRRGVITVKAQRGSTVTVEQLKHEFWFGCAIPNFIGSNSGSASDRNQFKEKFLENFNSAVTENAVKWGNMEPRKGEVNYSVIDGILNFTEANHIPCRGHNIFWESLSLYSHG